MQKLKNTENWSANARRPPDGSTLCTGALPAIFPRSEVERRYTSLRPMGKDYELARVELATYLFPREVNINRKKYQLHHPGNGIPFTPDDRLKVQWDTRHFAVHVSDEEPGWTTKLKRRLYPGYTREANAGESCSDAAEPSPAAENYRSSTERGSAKMGIWRVYLRCSRRRPISPSSTGRDWRRAIRGRDRG